MKIVIEPEEQEQIIRTYIRDLFGFPDKLNIVVSKKSYEDNFTVIVKTKQKPDEQASDTKETTPTEDIEDNPINLSDIAF